MKTLPITREDRQLIAAAKDIITKFYKPDRHQVGAALRTKSGKVLTAISLEANVGPADICAEAVVIGKAASEGRNDFDTIVAVRHPHPSELDQNIKVVAPCGVCRELISAYGQDVKVIFRDNDRLRKAKVSDLLPCKYTRQ